MLMKIPETERSVNGYYRFPTISKDGIAFVSEDDIWTIPVGGGIARRLTANLGSMSSLYYSPDGTQIAFTGREEGHNEVYCMSAEGGPVKRLTYLGVSTNVMGWTPDGASILFSSDHEQPIDRIAVAFSISAQGGMPVQLPIGPALSISMAHGNKVVIGRNNNDPARWKRYKGGTAGDIWIDADGSGNFKRLLTVNGNAGRPMWIGDRIYFLSDHNGVANIYSVTTSGEELTQHTQHQKYFARYPSTDGTRIVYHAGADLYVYNTDDGTDTKISVEYHSPFVQRQRKFIDTAKYLEDYALSPKGDSVAITSRGSTLVMGAWEGAVTLLSENDKADAPRRTRAAAWLNDGKRIALISDNGGDEAVEIHTSNNSADPVRLSGLDVGKTRDMECSPSADKLAISNHRNELFVIDVPTSTLTLVDRSLHSEIKGFSWSPDGRWLAYGYSATQYTSTIKLWDSTTLQTHTITEPMLQDTHPSFDPEGKYLYFIGQRTFNPVYDNLHFELGFPKGSKPYLVTLQSSMVSPFQPSPHPLSDSPKSADKPADGSVPSSASDPEGEKLAVPPAEEATVKPVVIDLEGIVNRIIAFPVPEGLYGRIVGIRGKALFSAYPVQGAISTGSPEEQHPRGTLESYDFKELKHEVMFGRLSGFRLGADYKTLIYRSSRRLRVVAAGTKPDEKQGQESGRKSGWIDLSRIRVSINPAHEWQQMAKEAWGLQRDHFWTENMSNIDWIAVWNRYSPLIERVGSRSEFSDLMWEMQGELGTSHAYESGGDYRTEPSYPQGFLGANLQFNSENGTYSVAHILQGDAGDIRASSPLAAPGSNVKLGDILLSINGKKLTAEYSPYMALTHQAGQEVTIGIRTGEEEARTINIITLKSETTLRYREWVEANRKYVHEATAGKVGYVHVPDMGANGFAEFHRLYLSEVDREAMIIDVRFNRGGHVSQLLIEKLNRKRVGYDIPRWAQPEPYPAASVAGPIVALTNQFAGSDGDIFSHVFKLMKLGTLIGKRTWGGVIGISPRHHLADGAVTTQPEYSFWFKDVGWGVENYGTDPDIDIDIAPQDFANGRDPQMAKALEVILDQLKQNPVVMPTFDARPSLKLPWD